MLQHRRCSIERLHGTDRAAEVRQLVALVLALAHLQDSAMAAQVFHMRFCAATQEREVGPLLLPRRPLRWPLQFLAQHCIPMEHPAVPRWVWVQLPWRQLQHRQLSRPLHCRGHCTAAVAAQAVAVAVD